MLFTRVLLYEFSAKSKDIARYSFQAAVHKQKNKKEK